MDKHKYELTRCWIYAYGQFVDQAHRLSLGASLFPRIARDVIGHLNGFDNWSRLNQTLEDLHDIGCTLALDTEFGPAEVAFHNGVFFSDRTLSSLNNPVRMQ